MNRTDATRQSTLPSADERDLLGRIAFIAAVVSLIGFAVLFIGQFADPSVFHNGKKTTTANNVAFFAYVFGLLIAMFLGGAVSLYRRRGGHLVSRTPAALAFCYSVVFLIFGVIAAAFGD